MGSDLLISYYEVLFTESGGLGGLFSGQRQVNAVYFYIRPLHREGQANETSEAHLDRSCL